MTDEQMVTQDYAAGTVLFKDGDVGHEMFVIQSGKVRISKHVRDVEKTLGILGPGEFLGEMSILNNKPRSATATVHENARLMAIGPKTFDAMVRGNVEIAVRIIKKLAERLQEADEQIANLLLRDHSSRLVHYLVFACMKQGKPHAEGTLLELSLSDLAARTGVDMESITQVLDKLIKSKLARVNESSILIHDINRLQEFLNFLEMKEKFGEA